MGALPQRPPLPPISSKLEGDYLVKFRKLDMLADAVHLVVPWGSLVAIFFFTYLMVGQLAGKTTLAQIGVKVLADVKLPQFLAYIIRGWGTWVRNWRETPSTQESCPYGRPY